MEADDLIWIAHRFEQILTNIEVTEQYLYVYDMDFSFKQDLLLSIKNCKLSVIPSGSKQIRDLYNISPLVTEAIYVTKDRQLIIGAMDDGLHFPVGKKSKRQHFIINEKEKLIRTLDIEKDRMPPFTFPSRIASNLKGYIFMTLNI